MSWNYTPKQSYFKHRFDFEIGYLVKSPCKECENQIKFPACANQCTQLAEIHQLLAETVSCSRYPDTSI